MRANRLSNSTLAKIRKMKMKHLKLRYRTLLRCDLLIRLEENYINVKLMLTEKERRSVDGLEPNIYVLYRLYRSLESPTPGVYKNMQELVQANRSNHMLRSTSQKLKQLVELSLMNKNLQKWKVLKLKRKITTISFLALRKTLKETKPISVIRVRQLLPPLKNVTITSKAVEVVTEKLIQKEQLFSIMRFQTNTKISSPSRKTQLTKTNLNMVVTNMKQNLGNYILHKYAVDTLKLKT